MTNLEKYKYKIKNRCANGENLACAIAECGTNSICNNYYDEKCIKCVSRSLNWLLEEAPITYWSKVERGAPVYLLENDKLVGYFVAQYGGSVVVDVDEFNDKYVYDSWGANAVYAEESE